MRFPYKTVILLLLFLLVLYYGVMINNTLPAIATDLYIVPDAKVIKSRETLYFVYNKALYSEEQTIEIEDLDYAKGLIRALERGATNQDYKSIFDFEVSILSVEQLDNICYVNFSKSIEETSETTEAFDLYLWAIVDTLTARREIDFVQFLVEGSPKEWQIGDMAFSQPLAFSNRDLYVKARTATDAVRDFLDYMGAGRYDLAYGMLSEATRSEIDYAAFESFAAGIRTDYDAGFYFSKRFNQFDVVYVRYMESFVGEEVLNTWHEKWYVVHEDGAYRIDFISNLNEM